MTCSFRVLYQPKRSLIRLQEPLLPISEIGEQLSILRRTHISRPDYLGAIDISFVDNPVLMHARVFSPPDNDEVPGASGG